MICVILKNGETIKFENAVGLEAEYTHYNNCKRLTKLVIKTEEGFVLGEFNGSIIKGYYIGKNEKE